MTTGQRKPPKWPPLPTSISSATAYIFLFSFLLLHYGVTSDVSDEEKQALLSFIQKVKHRSDYSWDESKPVCNSTSVEDDNWKGVVCDPDDNFVTHLRIPAASLVGKIPPETIGKLIHLRVLSLHTNGLFGHIPHDFSNLVKLTQLYLNHNNFSGQLPNIKLKILNVTNNKFDGAIPPSLSNFPPSVFSGNNNLCGIPLAPCNRTVSPTPPPAEPQADETPKKKTKNKGVIVGVSVGSGLLLLILLCCLRKKMNKQSKQAPEVLPLQKSMSASRAPGTSTGGERNKFVFLDNAEGGIYSFDLEDMYRASPQLLGKGSAGMSYKVVMDGGTTVVVKRLKDVVVTEKEFESTMEVLGKMKNEHVISLRAYHYSKDEKMLVYDYMHAGSLSARLHARKGSDLTGLDWGHRIRIALSAAKGVAYLHEVGKLIHGNIKSSNVLLQHEDEENAIVCDFGLNTLFGPNYQVLPGYVAPEVMEDRKLTFESDVYSFGILLLELLTGKVPDETFSYNTNVREEWKADVFDVELMRYQNIEPEMVRLFKIAMECVSTMPNQRPSMHELVRKIEDLKQFGDDTSSKESSSHTPSTDSYTPFTDT